MAALGQISRAKDRQQDADFDSMAGCVEDIFVTRDSVTWAKVLSENNPRRTDIIKQVIDYAPTCHDPEELTSCIKAFMASNLPNDLVDLLSRIVVLGTQEHHRNNKYLQNLLLLTLSKLASCDALRESQKGMLMVQIKELGAYDWEDVAQLLVMEGLWEEAFVVYKRFGAIKSAISVLLNNMKDIERAKDYACFCESDEVWDMIKAYEDSA